MRAATRSAWVSTTARDGLSPKSATAGAPATATRKRPPLPPHVAISARATASPPRETARAARGEGRPPQRLHVVGEAHHADLRRRRDRAPGRLVVERDVPAGDRDP